MGWWFGHVSYDSRDTVPGRRRSRGLRDAATGTPPGSTLGHDTGVRHLPALSTPRGLFHEVAIGKIVLKYKSQSRLATLPKFAFFLVRGRRGADRARLGQSPGPGLPGAARVFKDLTCRVCHAAIRKREETSTASAAEAQGRDETWRGRGPPEACAQDGRGTGAAGRRSHTFLSPGCRPAWGPSDRRRKDAGAAEPRAPQGSQTTLSFSSCPTF